jgi:Ca2+-binding EF-hand superfamily protein
MKTCGSQDFNNRDVILVSGDMRKAFLDEQHAKHIRVQSLNGDVWVNATPRELNLIVDFVSQDSSFAEWEPTAGTRVGYDSTGVFLQENHCKRYFGIVREMANISLTAQAPEAVHKNMAFAASSARGSSDRLFAKVLQGVPTLAAEVRESVLRCVFSACDGNGNGVLEKDEMITLVRRVMPTMSGKQVMELMAAADTNGNKLIDYNEFISWLHKSAPPEYRQAFEKSINTEYDCVLALFRCWDKNGDGNISPKELKTVLGMTCPNMTPSQIKTLAMHMDKNKDNSISYQEFLDFIFSS